MGWFTEPMTEEEKQQMLVEIQGLTVGLKEISDKLDTLINKLKEALEL